LTHLAISLNDYTISDNRIKVQSRGKLQDLVNNVQNAPAPEDLALSGTAIKLSDMETLQANLPKLKK
jgi:uncharacterized protein involved in propanediol utilization